MEIRVRRGGKDNAFDVITVSAAAELAGSTDGGWREIKKSLGMQQNAEEEDVRHQLITVLCAHFGMPPIELEFRSGRIYGSVSVANLVLRAGGNKKKPPGNTENGFEWSKAAYRQKGTSWTRLLATLDIRPRASDEEVELRLRNAAEIMFEDVLQVCLPDGWVRLGVSVPILANEANTLRKDWRQFRMGMRLPTSGKPVSCAGGEEKMFNFHSACDIGFNVEFTRRELKLQQACGRDMVRVLRYLPLVTLLKVAAKIVQQTMLVHRVSRAYFVWWHLSRLDRLMLLNRQQAGTAAAATPITGAQTQSPTLAAKKAAKARPVLSMDLEGDYDGAFHCKCRARLTCVCRNLYYIKELMGSDHHLLTRWTLWTEVPWDDDGWASWPEAPRINGGFGLIDPDPDKELQLRQFRVNRRKAFLRINAAQKAREKALRKGEEAGNEIVTQKLSRSLLLQAKAEAEARKVAAMKNARLDTFWIMSPEERVATLAPLPTEKRVELIDSLTPEDQASTMTAMSPEDRATEFHRMTDNYVIFHMAAMSPEDRLSTLRAMESNVKRSVLVKITPEDLIRTLCDAGEERDRISALRLLSLSERQKLLAAMSKPQRHLALMAMDQELWEETLAFLSEEDRQEELRAAELATMTPDELARALSEMESWHEVSGILQDMGIDEKAKVLLAMEAHERAAVVANMLPADRTLVITAMNKIEQRAARAAMTSEERAEADKNWASEMTLGEMATALATMTPEQRSAALASLDAEGAITVMEEMDAIYAIEMMSPSERALYLLSSGLDKRVATLALMKAADVARTLEAMTSKVMFLDNYVYSVWSKHVSSKSTEEHQTSMNLLSSICSSNSLRRLVI